MKFHIYDYYSHSSKAKKVIEIPNEKLYLLLEILNEGKINKAIWTIERLNDYTTQPDTMMVDNPNWIAALERYRHSHFYSQVDIAIKAP